MFYMAKETELTPALLQKYINHFTTNDLPKLQKWQRYYEGKHDILNKAYTDESKSCNKIVTNFCKIITDAYSGYICGKPVSYTSNEDITDIQEVINYNDSTTADMKFINNMLLFGVAYEFQWLDQFAKNRYSVISPLKCFAIFDNTLEGELLYFVRWYDEDNFNDNTTVFIEVYSKAVKKVYKASGLSGSLEFVSEETHYFKDVPVTVAYLFDTETNIFNDIISLNDAYNSLQSAEIDDFEAWVDAYLTLKGVDADAEDIASMKANRVLILPEGADAAWLVKNANDTQIVNILKNIKENIFKITNCPDMADETFLAQSGTALAYKIIGFENVASGIVANTTKAIQRRIELICNILNLKASDAIWRDVNINFKRNLPVNLTELIQIINGLKGTVSDATLLAQIPFIDDVQAEIEAVQKQKQANMSLYSFDTHTHTDTEDEDEQEADDE